MRIGLFTLVSQSYSIQILIKPYIIFMKPMSSFPLIAEGSSGSNKGYGIKTNNHIKMIS